MVPERKAYGEGLTHIAGVARPVSLADEQSLPVLPPLEPLLPRTGLQRGFTVVVEGGPGVNSLALALAAGPSKAGSWVAVAGMPALGIAAAAEMGIVLERLILIAAPSPQLWPAVAGALIDAFDLVLVAWPNISGTMARRLGHRMRERRGVLISLTTHSAANSSWSDAADLRLRVIAARWHGIGCGHGRLQSREALVETSGRRSAMPRRTLLRLPDCSGGVASTDAHLAEGLTSQPSKAISAGGRG
ncbi:MAG: hypothetical protein M3164_05790 [Actinomycetota bacterium]|nr:hypothetical protein [Actinomycetota bacterium]